MKLEFFTSANGLQQHLTQLGISQSTYITDSNCLLHCIPHVVSQTELTNTFVFEAGEQNKNSHTFLNGIEYLAVKNLSRKAILINIGGGVTTDLGGFMAATYKRGVRFINIPTSLMGMVDASIGGKVGINHRGLKNYIGAFYRPESVLICPAFLDSLPRAEIISGFAEVLKHGLIADRSYWEVCKKLDIRNSNGIDWMPIVKKSAAIKSDVVSRDHNEQGVRKALNFGHTIGHAIESFFLQQNKNITHGQAVAAGMLCESYIAHNRIGLSEDELKDIHIYIKCIYDKLPFDVQDIEPILEYMRFDKKNMGNTLLFSLIPSIGSCETDIEVSENKVRDALEYYLKN